MGRYSWWAKAPQRLSIFQIIVLSVWVFTQAELAYANSEDSPMSEQKAVSLQTVHPADPWEKWNRSMFRFNDFADHWVLHPIAVGWNTLMPEILDVGTTNFFENLEMVPTVANSLFQFKLKNVAVGSGRFVLNSTLGLLGFFDVATGWGFERQTEDFGQTLAHYGAKSGPYMVLPLLGPSTVRDSIGLVPDIYLSPLYSVKQEKILWGLTALKLIDLRADLLDVEALITGDRYTFIRDAYLQRRAAQVADGAVEDTFGDDDFSFDDFEEDELDDL
ncbi:MAG: VacJ family lipoprotein [Pseudomonadales bacterium]